MYTCVSVPAFVSTHVYGILYSELYAFTIIDAISEGNNGEMFV